MPAVSNAASEGPAAWEFGVDLTEVSDTDPAIGHEATLVQLNVKDLIGQLAELSDAGLVETQEENKLILSPLNHERIKHQDVATVVMSLDGQFDFLGLKSHLERLHEPSIELVIDQDRQEVVFTNSGPRCVSELIQAVNRFVEVAELDSERIGRFLHVGKLGEGQISQQTGVEDGERLIGRWRDLGVSGWAVSARGAMIINNRDRVAPGHYLETDYSDDAEILLVTNDLEFDVRMDKGPRTMVGYTNQLKQTNDFIEESMQRQAYADGEERRAMLTIGKAGYGKSKLLTFAKDFGPHFELSPGDEKVPGSSLLKLMRDVYEMAPKLMNDHHIDMLASGWNAWKNVKKALSRPTDEILQNIESSPAYGSLLAYSVGVLWSYLAYSQNHSIFSLGDVHHGDVLFMDHLPEIVKGFSGICEEVRCVRPYILLSMRPEEVKEDYVTQLLEAVGCEKAEKVILDGVDFTDDEKALEFVNGMLPEETQAKTIQPQLKQALVKNCGKAPLHAVRFISLLRDSGNLQVIDGQVQLLEAQGDVGADSDMSNLLGRKLDELDDPEGARVLIFVLAILGQSVSMGKLVQMGKKLGVKGSLGIVEDQLVDSALVERDTGGVGIPYQLDIKVYREMLAADSSLQKRVMNVVEEICGEEMVPLDRFNLVKARHTEGAMEGPALQEFSYVARATIDDFKKRRNHTEGFKVAMVVLKAFGYPEGIYDYCDHGLARDCLRMAILGSMGAANYEVTEELIDFAFPNQHLHLRSEDEEEDFSPRFLSHQRVELAYLWGDARVKLDAALKQSGKQMIAGEDAMWGGRKLYRKADRKPKGYVEAVVHIKKALVDLKGQDDPFETELERLLASVVFEYVRSMQNSENLPSDLTGVWGDMVIDGNVKKAIVVSQKKLSKLLAIARKDPGQFSPAELISLYELAGKFHSMAGNRDKADGYYRRAFVKASALDAPRFAASAALYAGINQTLKAREDEEFYEVGLKKAFGWYRQALALYAKHRQSQEEQSAAGPWELSLVLRTLSVVRDMYYMHKPNSAGYKQVSLEYGRAARDAAIMFLSAKEGLFRFYLKDFLTTSAPVLRMLKNELVSTQKVEGLSETGVERLREILNFDAKSKIEEIEGARDNWHQRRWKSYRDKYDHPSKELNLQISCLEDLQELQAA